MSGYRTLTEALEDAERTDPAVAQAAKNYDLVTRRLLRRDSSGLTCSRCGGPRQWRGVRTKRCDGCDVYLDRPCACTHAADCSESK